MTGCAYKEMVHHILDRFSIEISQNTAQRRIYKWNSGFCNLSRVSLWGMTSTMLFPTTQTPWLAGWGFLRHCSKRNILFIVISQGRPHCCSWLGAVHWEVPCYRRPEIFPVISRIKAKDQDKGSSSVVFKYFPWSPPSFDMEKYFERTDNAIWQKKIGNETHLRVQCTLVPSLTLPSSFSSSLSPSSTSSPSSPSSSSSSPSPI